MSVILEFAMFPTGKSGGVSEYVSKIVENIRKNNFSYQLTAMGTLLETNTLEEALDIVNQSYKVIEPFSERVYCTIKLDIRKQGENRLLSKVASIENRIGEVKK